MHRLMIKLQSFDCLNRRLRDINQLWHAPGIAAIQSSGGPDIFWLYLLSDAPPVSNVSFSIQRAVLEQFFFFYYFVLDFFVK